MLNNDYKDILLSLNAAQARSILVGAYAMAAHGFPRATLDIDIWFSPDPKNAEKVYQALTHFGAPMNQFSLEDFRQPDMVFQLGVAPRRIDLMTSISGVDFDEAYARAAELDLDGISIKVLSIQDLINNKSVSGRPKDLVDVQTLKKQISS